jgi:nucleoside diphosphate kinase
VLGAHQFLAETAGHTGDDKPSPESLSALNTAKGSARLAGGTYLLKHEFADTKYLLLNVFHPSQLVPYTSAGRGLIVFEGRSDVPWEDLRSNVCGATDPAKAEAGSIRQLLLSKKDELELPIVNMSNNGCHMSAGPLEALVELRRFFGEACSTSATHFGAALLAAGATEEQITSWSANGLVNFTGVMTPAYDLTEEKSHEDALTLLTA